MRKIPTEVESPIDDLVLKFAEETGIMEWFYKNNFTPNMLTTIGNVFRAISIYAILTGKPVVFLLTAILGFIFDCFDGHYARQFNMTTRIGDFYDHTSDLVYHIILIWFIYNSTKFRNLKGTQKWLIIGGFIALAVAFLMHMGCQEQYYGSDETDVTYSATLSPFKAMCPNKDWINQTKYFGTGTFVLYMYLVAFFLLF